MPAEETMTTIAVEDEPHAPALTPETSTGGAHDAEEHLDAGDAIHLPPESIWPIALAFAITIIMFGLVTNFLVSIPGFLLFVVSIRAWVAELMHAHH
jgi:hypothetical protein